MAGTPPADGLLEIGAVTRAHGLRGDVVVWLSTNRVERLSPGTVLTTVAGERRVESSQPHGDRWLVHFAGADDRAGADALRGPLLAPPISDPDALWVHELVGLAVSDTAGRTLGRVVAVVANPASDLLELEGGTLVPLAFLVGRDEHGLTVDPPAGLVD